MSPNKHAITFTFHSVGGGDQFEMKVCTNVGSLLSSSTFLQLVREGMPFGPASKYPCATTLYLILGRASRQKDVLYIVKRLCPSLSISYSIRVVSPIVRLWQTVAVLCTSRTFRLSQTSSWCNPQSLRKRSCSTTKRPSDVFRKARSSTRGLSSSA